MQQSVVRNSAIKNVLALFEDKGALTRLILIIYENNHLKGKRPLDTRTLIEMAGSTHSGQQTIRRAWQQGYIDRIKVKRKKGDPDNPVGQPPTLHVLTESGKALAKRLAAIPYDPSVKRDYADKRQHQKKASKSKK